MTDFVKEEKGNVSILRLSGELVMQNADRLRSMVIELLGTADHVEIDLSSVTGADLSFLQLLCSAHKTAARLGKTIAFLADIPASFIETAERAGYRRDRGCAVGAAGTCLWKEVPHG